MCVCVCVCVLSLLPDGFHSAGKSPLGWFVVTFSVTLPQCSAASCRPEEAVQDVFTAQRRNTKEQQQTDSRSAIRSFFCKQALEEKRN